MKLAEVDWSVLRGSMVLLAVSLAVSGALVAGAYYFSTGVTAQHQQEFRRLARARGSYLTLDDEQRLIDTYYPMYLDLQRRGIVGQEHRLQWVETLRAAAAKIKLPTLRYEISSRDRYEPDFPISSGRYQVFASDMYLTIGLLHEEDLPALLAELRRAAKGLFSVADCTLRRSGPLFQQDPTKENLKARCAVRWYTINLPEEGGSRA